MISYPLNYLIGKLDINYDSDQFDCLFGEYLTWLDSHRGYPDKGLYDTYLG